MAHLPCSLGCRDLVHLQGHFCSAGEDISMALDDPTTTWARTWARSRFRSAAGSGRCAIFLDRSRQCPSRFRTISDENAHGRHEAAWDSCGSLGCSGLPVVARAQQSAKLSIIG